MYKLLCSNITKSHRSLTNFTGYYRKVAQKCNRSASSGKKLLPETEAQTKQAVEDGTDPVECPEDALDPESPTEKKPRGYSSFFAQNIGIASLDRPDLIATSAGSSRFFHCCTSDNKSSTAAFTRHFKDEDAQKYYQQAIEQCNNIKSSLDRIHQQSNWAPRPSYPAFKVRKDFEHIEAKQSKEKPKPKTLKNMEKERLVTIPELERIAQMQTKKPKSQFKDSTMRITYPTHVARYKVGGDGCKPQQAVKKVVAKSDQKKGVCKDLFPEPFKIAKNKDESSTEVDRATVLNMRSKHYQRRLQQKCKEDACGYTKQQMKLEQGEIQQHPTVRKANSTARMAFKNKYNKLLKKSSLLYQAPNTRDDLDVAQDKDHTENWEPEPPRDPKSPQTNTREYEEIIFRKKDMREPQVSEHPISIARQPKVDSALKYPKRIISEKSENYDIDATCIKDNYKSNVTRTYGDFIAESEDKVKSFVETHKLEEKELLEEHEDMRKQAERSPEPESPVTKEPTPTDGIGEYLKKLKELRDQTAIDTIIIKKAEPAKLQDTPKMEGEEAEAPVKKFDDTQDTEKIPMKKLDQVDKTPEIDEKVEPKSEWLIEKEAPKTKQYPISDKFVVKKDEDTFIRKTVNTIKDTIIRKNRPNTAKVRSQSVDNPNQETSSINRNIALKTIRSEDLTKKVISIRTISKAKAQQPTIRPVLVKTRNENAKKIKLIPEQPSVEKPQDRLPKPLSSKETDQVETGTMKKIMEQYQVPVKVEFRMSMAEMKRNNRRKRREREKRLRVEAKMQEKKLQEDALKAMKENEAVREQERKHRYRLEDLVTAVKEVLRGKEQLILKEAREDTVVKTQDHPEVVVDVAPAERTEVDLKEKVEKVESEDLTESGIEEKVACSTAETKVVNFIRKPEEIPPTNLEVNENLVNKIVKGADQAMKPSAEENLSEPKGIKDKTVDTANEGVHTLKKEAESNTTEKKEKKQKANYPRKIIKAAPRQNLEKASDKIQPLQEKNLLLHKKAQDEAKIDLERAKNQTKLKTKKAKVKTQVLGKRKDLPHTNETSKELATTAVKNEEKWAATDAEKAKNKGLEEMRNLMKENLEKQSIPTQEVKPKNILDVDLKNVLAQSAPKENLEKTTKGAEQQVQPTKENNLEGSNSLTENKMESPKKELEGTSSYNVKENLDNQIKPSEEVKQKSVTEKVVPLLKDPEKMSIKEIEEEEEQLLKKINSLRVVKGKYLLSGKLTKDDKQESETVKGDITKALNDKVEVAKSSVGEKEQIERHKLEVNLEKHADIVKVANEKYLLEANLKQAGNAVKEEAVTENVGTTKEKESLAVPNKIEGTIAKEKEEKLKEKPTDVFLIKEKENNLKGIVIEEQKEKGNLQTSLQYSKDVMNKSLSITLEDKEIQILIKNVEKPSNKASDEKIVVQEDISGKINYKNVQEEIRRRLPKLKIMRNTSRSLEREKLKENMEKMAKKDENVTKSEPPKERARTTLDLKKNHIKATATKGLRKQEKNTDKPISDVTPVHKPNKHLKNASLDRKSLPEKNVQEKRTEALSEKRNQSIEKCPKKENNIINKINRLQQENVAKLKEASTKIVKLVKQIDLIKYAHKPEQRIEKLTVPHNQPTIRRDPPPKSKEKKKKEHPKSKTDIVLPSKGRNDPKTAGKGIAFEDPRRNIVEEINKVLSKVTHSSVPREETRKCKSLADVAGEQKAKILKEIEVTWNKENDKTKEKNLASSLDAKKCEGMEAIGPNKGENLRDYYDDIKDLPEKRKLNIGNTTFCMNTMENAKDKVSKLPIKITHKRQRDNPSSSRMEVQKTTDEVNDSPKNPRMGYTFNQPVSSSTTYQENNPKERIPTKDHMSDILVFKGSSDKQLDKSESRSILHLKKTKRGRIEDDFLKLSIKKDDPEESWYSQNDSDFAFRKLKRARIEDDFVADEKNEIEDPNTSLGTMNEKWKSGQDATLYLQKRRRRKIEDDFEATEKMQSDHQIVGKAVVNLVDLEGKREELVKKRPVKSVSDTEIRTKVASKNSKVKSDVEKLIHVMKKADKELEEVLKVYEILKIPKPQHRNLMKMESHNSRKREKLETRLRGSTELVSVKKTKLRVLVKDSKTYTVAGTKKSQVVQKKPPIEGKEDSGKDCNPEEKSTKAKDKPHKYLLTAGLQKEAKKQLKGKKEEVKCDHSDNETTSKKRKRAKICHKDEKETVKSCKLKELADKCKKKKSLCSEIRKVPILDCSKHVEICDKPITSTSAGEKTKDFSDTKLSVQLLPNEIDVLVNKIVVTRSQDTPGAKPKELDKSQGKIEKQEKPSEIPGKRKTNLRTEEKHVSISTDIPHTKPNKNIKSRAFDGSMVERRIASTEKTFDTEEGYNENNLPELSATNLKNSKSTADFPIVRSNLIDMFIKSKRVRNRKDKNVRTIFINRKAVRGTKHRSKSFLKKKSKSANRFNKKSNVECNRHKLHKNKEKHPSERSQKPPQKKKQLTTLEENKKKNKPKDTARLNESEEKIIKFAQNAMENILRTKYLLQQQLECLKVVALPRPSASTAAKTAFGDNSGKRLEKAKLPRIINMKQSGETHHSECGMLSKDERAVTPSVKILVVQESVQDLKTKFEEFFSNETNREETNGCMSKGNLKIGRGDCKKACLERNLKELPTFEEKFPLKLQSKEQRRVKKSKEKSSNYHLDTAHKKVRHVLSIVNEGNVKLERHIGVDEEMKKTEKRNADGEIIVAVEEDDTKLRKDGVFDVNFNTNVDCEKKEIGRQSVNYACNVMVTKSKHELGKEINGAMLEETSEQTAESEDGNMKFRKDRLPMKTRSNENRNIVEDNKKLEDKNKFNNDKTSLKAQESLRKVSNVGVKTKLKETENTNKTGVLKDTNKNIKVIYLAKNQPTNRTQSNVELRPIASLYKTEEDLQKEKKLASTTEPCLNKCTIYKPAEKNKYKYTTQKIRQSLMRPMINTNNTKGNGKREWQTQDEESKTSLHSQKKQKTGVEAIYNRQRTQLKTNYKYTNQNLKQHLMRRNERNMDNTTNENKKRARDNCASQTMWYMRKKQKRDLEIATVCNAIQEQIKINEMEDKGDKRDTTCPITGVQSSYVAPRNSDSDIRSYFEQSRVEKNLVPPTKNGNVFRKQSILNRVKRNALPTLREMPLESEECKEKKKNFGKTRKNDERKLVIPTYLIKSNDNIHNTILSSLRLTEKLIQKLSSERTNYYEDYNAGHGTIKARIEQILKKHYKEDEKIYKFNKYLIRHLRQPGEKNPHSYQKQQLILSLEPTSLEESRMQRMLYKLITSEFKKSEDSLGFSMFKQSNSWEGTVYYSQNKESNLPGVLPRRSATFYIEKAPRNRYTKEKNTEPLKPVTRSCGRLCLPLKAISQVALRPSVEEMTTLNKYHFGKIQVAPKIPDALEKYKDLKITYLRIKRPMAKPGEGFLPRIIRMDNDAEPNALEKVNDPERLKRQILEFRYELLRKLHKEFSALYDKDVNKNQGRFDKVSSYYKSVIASVKNRENKEIVVRQESKSLTELFEPTTKPSFDRVVRYYNLIMDTIKRKQKEGEWNDAKALVQKLPAEGTEIDKSRNNCKDADQILTKSMEKKASEDKDPNDPEKES